LKLQVELFALGKRRGIEDLAPAILIRTLSWRRSVLANTSVGQHKDLTAAAVLEWAGRYRVKDVAVAASIEPWDRGLGETQGMAHSVEGVSSFGLMASGS